MILPADALAVCRFLHDLSAMLVWGGYGYIFALVPAPLGERAAKRFDPIGLVAVALIAATAFVALPLRTAMIGNGWVDALNPQMLWDVASATHVGVAWQDNLATSSLLVAACLLPWRLRGPVLALGAGLVLITLTLTGHAVMHEGTIRRFQQANDALHVLAAGAWFGALVPLAIILKTADASAHWPTLRTSLLRFSIAGHIAVALAVATGVVNTLLIVGLWPRHWASPYVILLAVKVALVLLMIGLASLNRYRWFPRAGKDRAGAIESIRRGAWGEVAIGAAVIALVAVFGMMDPM